MVRKAKGLSKYFWVDNFCCCNIHSMPKDKGFIVTLIWVWISICYGSLDKLLKLWASGSSSAHRNAYVAWSSDSCRHCNELLVKPMREAGISCKVKSKNHPLAGSRSWGMNVWTSFPVPISYSPRVVFLSLLLFSLWTSFPILPHISSLCLTTSACLHLSLISALNSFRPAVASLVSLLSTFISAINEFLLDILTWNF